VHFYVFGSGSLAWSHSGGGVSLYEDYSCSVWTMGCRERESEGVMLVV
jgi:hypothetical protein